MGITRSEVTAWWADQIGLEAVLRSAAGAKRPLLILTWLRPLVEDDVADPVRARVGGSLLFSARESAAIASGRTVLHGREASGVDHLHVLAALDSASTAQSVACGVLGKSTRFGAVRTLRVRRTRRLCDASTREAGWTSSQGPSSESCGRL